MTPIVQDRLLELEQISLSSGGHEVGRAFCAMELAAYVAGEDWSDHPECVCPVIGAFMRWWNDGLPSDAERDRLLKPLISVVLDTKATRAVEIQRSYLALDWLTRVQAPMFLRLRDDLKAHAVALEGLKPLTDSASCAAAQPTLDAAGAAAWAAARDAAGAAAGAAAWAAARDAAGAAAWAAAWAAARDAAGAAAWAAAWAAAGAAARDAAWAAAGAAARDALAPTVASLQISASDLVQRMCALGKEP